MKPLLLLALLLCLGSSMAPAQTVRGTVRDEASERPVAGAAVFLTGAQGAVLAVTRSGPDGAYVLQSVAGDTVRIRAERLGFEPLETRPWVLARASVLELDLRLRPAPVVLDTITVTGRWRSKNRAGFEQRRRMEVWGRFADAERLAAVRSPRAVDRLRPVIPGLLVGADGTVRVRSKGAAGAAACQPRFYIDGTRFPGDLPLDVLVSGPSLRAVEFYDNPLTAPAQFTMGADPIPLGSGSPGRGGLRPPCAIIVLWTDIGFGEPRG